jgi:Chaperone of endosialidase
MKNRNIILTLCALACFGLLSKAQAVVPPPDGGYPNFTTAEGSKALQSLTTGVANTAVGWYSLFSNGEGSYNTATGTGALLFNIADENTAFGAATLLFNTTGGDNTAIGTAALLNNATGGANTATGRFALYNNTGGNNNTANGVLALFNNTTGGTNTATGVLALYNNTTGFSNTALGYFAGVNVTGDGNVCIGAGIQGEAGVDDSTYIRNVNTLTQNFSAGVNDYVTVRLADGRFGHTAVVSSQRYKQDIKPLAAASQALYALKPVSFRLKKEFDPTQALGFGLIAEEVEKVDPALVYHNDKGQVESVRYEMVNAMLLNEFLKEHRKNEEQQATIARQQKQIEMLAAGLQKVNARLEVIRPATQTALNNRGLQHGRGCGDPCAEHRRPKYGYRCGSTFKQQHRP